MKLHGKIIDLPKPEVLVIPRDDGDLVFKAAPVIDYGEFDRLCPRPTPPVVTYKGGKQVDDTSDKTYRESIDAWGQQKVDWLLIESLKATEGLEWDNVVATDPSTWKNARTELTSCLPDPTVSRIIDLVFQACGLNQEKIDEATKSFLAGQGEAQ